MDRLKFTKKQIDIRITHRVDWEIRFVRHIRETQFSGYEKVLFVIDTKVLELFKRELIAILDKTRRQSRVNTIVLVSREKDKSFKTVDRVINKAMKLNMSGNDVMVAIGGGVISDITGFAASIYRRGVKHIKVPTTLLGQIDASIGIKNGLNYTNRQKNFLGTFYPAQSVVICGEFLKYLSQREVMCGVAEIFKLAIISNKKLFHMVRSEYDKFADLWSNWKDKKIQNIIWESVRGMQNGLMNNYYEKNAKREVAFGHEIAHALEAMSSFSIPHGFAVSINVAVSSAIAFLKGYISAAELEEILYSLCLFKLPIWHELLNKIKYNHLIEHIKSQRKGNLHYVVPSPIGRSRFLEKLDEKSLKEAYAYLEQYQRTSPDHN